MGVTAVTESVDKHRKPVVGAGIRQTLQHILAWIEKGQDRTPVCRN